MCIRDRKVRSRALRGRQPDVAERRRTEMMVRMITPQRPYPYDAPASQALLTRAVAVTPGGVNSPVRAFRAVGGTPRFMASASGPYLTDVDGREYVDLVCSWGPMILGHAHPDVLEDHRTPGADQV